MTSSKNDLDLSVGFLCCVSWDKPLHSLGTELDSFKVRMAAGHSWSHTPSHPSFQDVA